MNVMRASVVVSFVGILLITSCGGGSSSDPVAVCKEGCTKYLSLCLPDAGELGAVAKAACESNCANAKPTGGTTCKNASAITTAYKACLDKTTCDDLTTCQGTIPACEGGGAGGTSGGTGGSTGGGTGGSTGTGTGGSTGTGATCADVLACCNAATNATIKTICMMQYTAIMSAGDATCALYLTPELKATYCP